MREQYDENLLIGYVEDELSGDERTRVQRWLDADPGLRRLIEGMVADRAALRRLPEPAAPEGLLDEVDAGLEREMLLGGDRDDESIVVEEKRSVLRRIGAVAALAAMLLIGVVTIGPSLLELYPKPVEDHREVAVDTTGRGADPLPPAPVVVGKSGAAPAPGEGVSLGGLDRASIDPTRPGPSPPDEQSPLAGADDGDAETMDAEPPVPEQGRAIVAKGVAPISDELADAAAQVAAESVQVEQAVAPVNEVVMLRVNTRDFERSINQLAVVKQNIDRAEVKADVASPADAPRDDQAAEPMPSKLVGAHARRSNAESSAQPRPTVAADAAAAPSAAQAADPGAAQAGPPAAVELKQLAQDRRREVAVRRERFRLAVPRDQVERAIELLEDAPNADYQDVVVSRVQAPPDATPRNSTNWPRFRADYGGILREQLALSRMPEAQPPKPGESTQVIEVLIEEALPAIDADAIAPEAPAAEQQLPQPSE